MKRSIWLRYVAVVFVALGLMLGSQGAALAAEESGTGTIHAKGVGYVRLEGDGTVTIARGTGTIWITGAEEIKTEGKGRRTVLADGTVRLTGWSGTVTITGEDVVVKMSGGAIDFTASGTGSALLKGKGNYEVGDTSGSWTKAGVTIGY